MTKRKQKRGEEKRLSAVFIHFVKYDRDGGRKPKGGKLRNYGRERGKRKGYLYRLFIFDHLSLHFVAFATQLM